MIGWQGNKDGSGRKVWKFVGAVHLVEDDSAGVSCSDIAKRTGAEYALIGGYHESWINLLFSNSHSWSARTMKHLAKMHIVAENDVDSYTSSPLCKALTEPRFRHGLIYTSASLPILQ